MPSKIRQKCKLRARLLHFKLTLTVLYVWQLSDAACMPVKKNYELCKDDQKETEPAAAASFQLSTAVYTAMRAPKAESPAPLVLRTLDGFKNEGKTMGFESSDMKQQPPAPRVTKIFWR